MADEAVLRIITQAQEPPTTGGAGRPSAAGGKLFAGGKPIPDDVLGKMPAEFRDRLEAERDADRSQRREARAAAKEATDADRDARDADRADRENRKAGEKEARDKESRDKLDRAHVGTYLNELKAAEDEKRVQSEAQAAELQALQIKRDDADILARYSYALRRQQEMKESAGSPNAGLADYFKQLAGFGAAATKGLSPEGQMALKGAGIAAADEVISRAIHKLADTIEEAGTSLAKRARMGTSADVARIRGDLVTVEQIEEQRKRDAWRDALGRIGVAFPLALIPRAVIGARGEAANAALDNMREIHAELRGRLNDIGKYSSDIAAAQAQAQAGQQLREVREAGALGPQGAEFVRAQSDLDEVKSKLALLDRQRLLEEQTKTLKDLAEYFKKQLAEKLDKLTDQQRQMLAAFEKGATTPMDDLLNGIDVMDQAGAGGRPWKDEYQHLRQLRDTVLDRPHFLGR